MKDEINSNVGGTLKIIRDNLLIARYTRGWGQEFASDRAGISFTTFRDVEKIYPKVTFRNYLKVAIAYDLGNTGIHVGKPAIGLSDEFSFNTNTPPLSTEEIGYAISRNIRGVREGLNLKQSVAAEGATLTVKAYSAVESGTPSYELNSLINVLRFYGLLDSFVLFCAPQLDSEGRKIRLDEGRSLYKKHVDRSEN